MKIVFKANDGGTEYKILLNEWHVGVVKLHIWSKKWTMHPSFFMPYNFMDVSNKKYDSAYEAGKKMVDLYNAVFPPYVNESDSNFGLSLEEVVSFLKTRE
jgi:hypothetical protein